MTSDPRVGSSGREVFIDVLTTVGGGRARIEQDSHGYFYVRCTGCG
jgi:hypothetical protein